jgi:hypothetical protein
MAQSIGAPLADSLPFDILLSANKKSEHAL